MAKDNKKLRRTQPVTKQKNDAETKTCTKCRATKPIDQFYRDKRASDGRVSICKKCNDAKNSAWARAHPKERAVHTFKWRATNSNRFKTIAAKWQRAHPGRSTKQVNRWRKDNPDKFAMQSRTATGQRRASKLHATPPWANKFFISEAYDLARRRTKATGFEWHVDHIFPLKHKLFCGLHVEYNLQVIPAVENLHKGNSIPLELLGASIVC